jgi:nicotinamide phosphoribosyltransferase
VEALAEKFGTIVNGKGFKVLPSCVRVIQGDGINEDSIRIILARLEGKGFSADNVAFGMGGALLQQVNRDTQKFAMKASAVNVNGVWQDIYKAPAGDPSKRSKAGRLCLVREEGEYMTVPAEGHQWRDQLIEVWREGELRRDWTFAEVRERSNET